MTPIRILHVVRAGRAEGGMENGIVNLAAGMDDRFAIGVCALDVEETFSQRIRRPGATFFTLPPRRPGIDWTLIHRIGALVRRERVDVLHSHNWGSFLYGVLGGRLGGAAVVHGEHGKNMSELAPEGSAKRLAKRWIAPRADALLSVCEDIRGEWMARYGIAATLMRTIRNGVDAVRFRPGDAAAGRQLLGLPADSFVIGTAGRLDPIKNLPALLRAAARAIDAVPNLQLVFIGSGPLERELRTLAHSLGIADRAHFAGLHSNMERLYPALDVFVLPSLSEGMSNVLVEAMSCGIPVVCADLPSHREIVTPGLDAVLLRPCDDAAIAATLIDLYRSPSTRAALGANARGAILERFTLARMIGDYQDVYLEVLARRRRYRSTR